MRRITASLPAECKGISNGFFGQALTFAGRLMQHTVNQLQQWAKEPDLGVKSFASSLLLTSQSICLPYQGMVLDRTSNSSAGFIFRAESCSGICSGQRFNSGLQCSFCDSQKKWGSEKIRQLIKPSTGFVGKQAMIQKISMNPAMAAMEISKICEENRRLRHELAWTVGWVVGMATSDAAGCNWVSYCDTLSTHTFQDALPREMIVKYPTVNFDVKCLLMDSVTLQWIVFLPNMCHLTKNIATSLELSSSKNLKRNLMYDNVPVKLIWEWSKKFG